MSCGGHVVSRPKRTFIGSEYSSNNVEEHALGSHRRHDVRSTKGSRELGVLWRWISPIFSKSNKCNKAVSYGYIPSIILSDWDKPRKKQQGQSTRDSKMAPAKSSHGDSRSAIQICSSEHQEGSLSNPHKDAKSNIYGFSKYFRTSET